MDELGSELDCLGASRAASDKVPSKTAQKGAVEESIPKDGQTSSSSIPQAYPPNTGTNLEERQRKQRLLHERGLCRPCAHFHKPHSCSLGANCEFCHLCTADELRERQLQRKKAGKKKRRAERRQARKARQDRAERSGDPSDPSSDESSSPVDETNSTSTLPSASVGHMDVDSATVGQEPHDEVEGSKSVGCQMTSTLRSDLEHFGTPSGSISPP
mmetsp:Transcript_10450/g.18840  ORF Transcript_10450/g.18840 Transcript_10450/m.18840 type:complete len:215 (+) Transcript_10450:87-731(+)